ncbi:hypothetical protein C1Y40_03515 [Mycobacterium talmoniae]|uniref:Uncharacterized protein n=1 Tax=Mycobacterium talmoniae TaxID=1858794 RepID=A0A2S8BI16_9MYCO|nr:hypothetical protein C1Y40_03515 [Mycobacterium talmoniae]
MTMPNAAPTATPPDRRQRKVASPCRQLTAVPIAAPSATL